LSTSVEYVRLGYAFCTELRGAAKISPGNVVKPTGARPREELAWPPELRLVRSPSTTWLPWRGAGQPVQGDVVADPVSGEMACGLVVEKGAGDLVVAVEQPGGQGDG
jgi:hypothetical protein